MADSPGTLVEICTTGADGIRHCIEQSSGVLIFGPSLQASDVMQGLMLMLVAYLTGFAVAGVKSVFVEA